MKKILLLLASCFLFLEVSHAQPAIQWQKCLGGTNWDYAYSVEQTADGGYIVAGQTLSNNGDVTGAHGDNECWVVKLDSSGNIQWQKCLGGTNEEGANSVQQTADGGYIVAGFTESNDGDVAGNHGSADSWIIKLNSSGNIDWQKCLGGTNGDAAYSVEQTSDGGYIVAGSTSSINGDVTGHHLLSDYWVVKLNSSGNLQWQKCLGGTDDEWATSVQQTADGGYIVAGETKSNDGDVTGNHGFRDCWIVKLDNSGSLQWQKCFGGTYTDWATSVQQTADGGYIVAGYAGSNDGDVIGNHDSDYWVIKLNSSGTIQWQKCLGGTYTDEAHSVRQTTDGGYIIAGVAGSNDGDVTGLHGSGDYWVVKLNSSGNIQWQKCLGGTDYDKAYFVQQTADAGFIVAGYTESNDGDVTGFYGVLDYWIVKLSPYVGIEEETNNSFVNLFPNPATSELVVSGLEFAGKSEIEIYNVLGERIYSQQETSNQQPVTVNVSQLPSGIYFVKVKTEKEERVGKFVKE